MAKRGSHPLDIIIAVVGGALSTVVVSTIQGYGVPPMIIAAVGFVALWTIVPSRTLPSPDAFKTIVPTFIIFVVVTAFGSRLAAAMIQSLGVPATIIMTALVATAWWMTPRRTLLKRTFFNY